MKTLRSILALIAATLALLCAPLALFTCGSPQATGATTVVVNSYRFAAFTPTDISGLQIWLKADAITGSDGDAIATWEDSSAANHDATQGTSGYRPTLQSDGGSLLNGLPVVRFDGVDDKMTLGDLSASFPSAATLFIVAKINTDDNYSLMGSKVLGGTYDFWRWTGDTYGFIGMFRASRLTAYPTSMPTTGTHLFTLTSSASAYVFRKNGVAQADAGAGHSGGDSYVIGANSDDQSFFAGDIAEVIAYDTALSSDDITRVETYLAAKWGISL